jgi:hypothetical protein
MSKADIHKRISRRLVSFLSNKKSADRVAAEIIQMIAVDRASDLTGETNQ